MRVELSLVLSLRKVLGSAADGRGIAGALVQSLSGSAHGKEVARLTLLGFPTSIALAPLIKGKSAEVSILASLIVASQWSSVLQIAVRGEALSLILERWLKNEENARLVDRVMTFRSLVVSGVLGAVTGMIAAIGPLVGALSFSPGAGSGDPGALTVAAGAMAVASSALLGAFMSGRRFFVNVIVSLFAFILVTALVAPLAAVPTEALWGIK